MAQNDPASAETERRLVDLEIRLSYIEKTLETLDDLVTGMRDRQEELAGIQQELVDQIRQVSSPLNADGRVDPLPPHY
ncbi:MAG: SlyX family protein [Fibrobacterales bacterium]|nr:SlyX family protein [Fibrobacterales bacterium]